MTEVLWPPDLVPSMQTWRQIGNAAVFTGPFSGASRAYGRPGGSRMGCVITLPPVKGEARARMLAVVGALRDRANYIWMPDFTTTLQSGAPVRGSFPATELLTNNDFASGTTGWSVNNGAVTSADRVLRLTASQAASFEFYRSATVTQYAPHALRAMVTDGAHSSALSAGPYMSDGTSSASNTGTSRGLRIASFTPMATSVTHYPITVLSASGFTAGAYFDCHWSSAGRCILVDGGGNALTYSDQFDNAAWIKTRSTVSANAGTAPDGTSTADALVEDSSTNTHLIDRAVTVASAAADYCFTVAVKAVSRFWCAISMTEATGSTAVTAYFNLSTGAVGASPSAGANWSNLRVSSAVDIGDGWWQCTIVARKTNAATTVTPIIFMANADGGASYAGDGSSSIRVWRGTFAQSSNPVRLSQAVAAAVSASTQTGSGIYVKGLPASTNGLLEAGDFVQVGTQLNRVTSRLNSDAAGKGYLQCSNPFRSATNDAPVIVNTPMCKMRVTGDIEIETGPAQFSAIQLELEEVIE